ARRRSRQRAAAAERLEAGLAAVRSGGTAPRRGGHRLAARANQTAPCSQPLPSRHYYYPARRAAATGDYSSDTWIVCGSTRNVTNLQLQWFERQLDCSIGPARRPTAVRGPHGSIGADDYP